MLSSVGWFRTDVSGLRIGPIFNQSTLRNIPEDDRIQVNRSRSLGRLVVLAPNTNKEVQRLAFILLGYVKRAFDVG
jgi:hypothetical protein